MTLDLDAESVARLFHETYERLAPDYGYRTREASAKPWADVPTQNKLLMVATVGYVLAELDAARAERTEPATSEDERTPLDVETIGDALVTYVGGLGLDPTMIRPYGAANAILAALDLPGRERALREAEAQRDHWIEANHQLGKRYVAVSEWVKTRIDERNQARYERDAALAELVRLKDGPRDEEYVRAKVAAWNMARQCLGEGSASDSDVSDRFTWGGVQSD